MYTCHRPQQLHYTSNPFQLIPTAHHGNKFRVFSGGE